MRHFHRLAEGIDVQPLLGQLDQQPELWDQIPFRRTAPNSPHAAMKDIWIRYRPPVELLYPWSFAEPFHSVFYPAWRVLPALKPITFGLMSLVSAVELGGILLTRIPPGGAVMPHDDRGKWHAEWFNLKVYIPLRSNDQCINFCGGDEVVMRAGEAWVFDNLVEHATYNRGDTERITLIVCMRVEG